MGDDAAPRHVGAVADAGGVVSDRRRRHAERIEIGEPGDSRLLQPDPGVVENDRTQPRGDREPGGINPAMRTGDKDGADMGGAEPGDAVGDEEAGCESGCLSHPGNTRYRGSDCECRRNVGR